MVTKMLAWAIQIVYCQWLNEDIDHLLLATHLLFDDIYLCLKHPVQA